MLWDMLERGSSVFFLSRLCLRCDLRGERVTFEFLQCLLLLTSDFLGSELQNPFFGFYLKYTLFGFHTVELFGTFACF